MDLDASGARTENVALAPVGADLYGLALISTDTYWLACSAAAVPKPGSLNSSHALVASSLETSMVTRTPALGGRTIVPDGPRLDAIRVVVAFVVLGAALHSRKRRIFARNLRDACQGHARVARRLSCSGFRATALFRVSHPAFRAARGSPLVVGAVSEKSRNTAE